MERELVEAARRGDRAAYDVLVRRKVESVYRTARTILGNEADAQDATQEAFVAAWRHLPRLRDPERFDAWLGRIVVNACRQTLRHRGAVREIAMPEDAGERHFTTPAAADPGSSVIDALSFDRAFERLSVDDRVILTLHHADGRGLDEIGDILGIPTGTVKSRLLRARRALERSLDRERPS
ncbi:MAG: sigma-70 family RNA polymerase sigma factor [Chloroflexi bacterium]|nr:sigma-70 family RNA polymerase sigma factor [Chloroflexota bacterium]